jgi:hypothetical protein
MDHGERARHLLYIKWEQGGDQFIGRCLALLLLLKPKFGVSQPHFAAELPRLWISETAAATYAMVSSLQSQIRLVEMCLAQLIYHHSMILQWDLNHVICLNCQVFQNPSLMEAKDGDQLRRFSQIFVL